MSLGDGIAQTFEILLFQNSLMARTGPDLEEVYGRVVSLFERLGVQWTLIGAHAVNAYVRPRATVDVDSSSKHGRSDACSKSSRRNSVLFRRRTSAQPCGCSTSRSI